MFIPPTLDMIFFIALFTLLALGIENVKICPKTRLNSSSWINLVQISSNLSKVCPFAYNFSCFATDFGVEPHLKALVCICQFGYLKLKGMLAPLICISKKT